MLNKIKADPFDAAPAAGATINLKLPTKRPIRLDAVVLRGIGYSASTSELILANVISEVQLWQDNKLKSRWKPSLLRKFDEYFNANAETLDVSAMTIPFNHYLLPNTGWGVGDIGSLVIKVIFVASFPANTTISALNAILCFHETPDLEPRGNVFNYGYLQHVNPVVGENVIADLEYTGVREVHKILLDEPAITRVELWLDTELKYQLDKDDQLYLMRQNPIYKVPSGVAHTRVQGQSVTSTGGFLINLDDLGLVGDAANLFDARGNRKKLKIVFWWDSTIDSTPQAIDILAQGIEYAVQAQGGSTANKA